MLKIGQLLIICALANISLSQTQISVKAGTCSNFRDYISISPEVKISDWSIFIASSIGGNNYNNNQSWILRAHNYHPITKSFDSIEYVIQSNVINRYLNFDIGGRYHFSLNDYNFFYSGASAGICLEKRMFTITNKALDMYNNPQLDPQYQQQYGAIHYAVIEESNLRYTEKNLAWRINLYLGIDIPLSDKFELNCEINAGFIYGSHQVAYLKNSAFVPTVRGGIKYHLKT